MCHLFLSVPSLFHHVHSFLHQAQLPDNITYTPYGIPAQTQIHLKTKQPKARELVTGYITGFPQYTVYFHHENSPLCPDSHIASLTLTFSSSMNFQWAHYCWDIGDHVTKCISQHVHIYSCVSTSIDLCYEIDKHTTIYSFTSFLLHIVHKFIQTETPTFTPIWTHPHDTLTILFAYITATLQHYSILIPILTNTSTNHQETAYMLGDAFSLFHCFAFIPLSLTLQSRLVWLDESSQTLS